MFVLTRLLAVHESGVVVEKQILLHEIVLFVRALPLGRRIPASGVGQQSRRDRWPALRAGRLFRLESDSLHV